ncbi:MAG: hypothetical protein CMN57_13550 [Gammaproteobacteria bacterium]|nr:hypothetical protein [Gammaproteobacteria bacterium]
MSGKHHKSTAFLVYLLVLVIALVPARLAVAVPAVAAQGDQSQEQASSMSHCEEMAIESGDAGNVIQGLVTSDDGIDCCDTVCDCPSCAQCLHAPGNILTLPGGPGNANPDFHPLMCAHAESALRGIDLTPPDIPPQA